MIGFLTEYYQYGKQNTDSFIYSGLWLSNNNYVFEIVIGNSAITRNMNVDSGVIMLINGESTVIRSADGDSDFDLLSNGESEVSRLVQSESGISIVVIGESVVYEY